MYYDYDIKKIDEAINALMDLEPSVKHGNYTSEQYIIHALSNAINAIEVMRFFIEKDHEEDA